MESTLSLGDPAGVKDKGFWQAITESDSYLLGRACPLLFWTLNRGDNAATCVPAQSVVLSSFRLCRPPPASRKPLHELDPNALLASQVGPHGAVRPDVGHYARELAGGDVHELLRGSQRVGAEDCTDSLRALASFCARTSSARELTLTRKEWSRVRLRVRLQLRRAQKLRFSCLASHHQRLTRSVPAPRPAPAGTRRIQHALCR